MNSFLIFFYLLDQCYDLCREDDLGGFLGSISPEILDDGLPADIAVFHDWEVEKNEPILEKSIVFLERYEKKYGYSFKETKEILKSNKSLELLRIAKKKAEYNLMNTEKTANKI